MLAHGVWTKRTEMGDLDLDPTQGNKAIWTAPCIITLGGIGRPALAIVGPLVVMTDVGQIIGQQRATRVELSC